MHTNCFSAEWLDWRWVFFLNLSMNLAMAVSAERDQIRNSIIAKSTAEANMVNLKILRGSTVLAPPAIAQ